MRCFTTRTEPFVTVEELFERDEKPTQITLPDGRVAYRDYHAELGGTPSFPENYPRCSDAAGVHPDQAKEAYEHSVRNGVPTQFNSEGQAVFTSKGHEAAYLKVAKLHHRHKCRRRITEF
jgi:hypothetical protein